MEHCGRIGPGLWEFIWLIDKITEEIDSKGIVLGGAPIKIGRIANDLDRGEHTVRRNLARLQFENYIERTRTPYGFTVRVRNSRKFQIWSGKEKREPGQPDRPSWLVSPTDLADLTVKNGRNKEDAVVDATVDAAEETAAAWPAIGSEKLGIPRFRAKWEVLFAHRKGDSLGDLMERCIIDCQEAGITVPKPFYDAKRRVEAREKQGAPGPREKDSGLDFLPEIPPLPCKT